MTYAEWLKKFPLPSNYVKDSAPVVARNLARNPYDKVEQTLLAVLRRIADNDYRRRNPNTL